MRTLIDDVVVFDGNRDAFQTVLDVTQSHSEPVRMFMYGPNGAGKSTVLFARAGQRDLLSQKKVAHCHAAQLQLAVSAEIPNEDLLFKVGTVDVLLIDGFEELARDPEMGFELCKLLVRHRDAQQLDTIIASDVPLARLDAPQLEGALDTFRQVEVLPLDAKGRLEFARRIEADIREEGIEAARVTDAAMDYAANEFAADVHDIRFVVRFLLTGTEMGAADEIDVPSVVELLNR